VRAYDPDVMGSNLQPASHPGGLFKCYRPYMQKKALRSSCLIEKPLRHFFFQRRREDSRGLVHGSR